MHVRSCAVERPDTVFDECVAGVSSVLQVPAVCCRCQQCIGGLSSALEV